MKNALLHSLITTGLHNNLLDRSFWQAQRPYLLARANRALKRNLADPGDCRDDITMLTALAVAEAQVGRSAGWIPEVQRIAYSITKAHESATK